MAKRKGKDVTVVDKQELTVERMRNIVKYYREGRFSSYRISLMYGLSEKSVHMIGRGEITPNC